jgi:hypothetical protein
MQQADVEKATQAKETLKWDCSFLKNQSVRGSRADQCQRMQSRFQKQSHDSNPIDPY